MRLAKFMARTLLPVGAQVRREERQDGNNSFRREWYHSRYHKVIKIRILRHECIRRITQSKPLYAMHSQAVLGSSKSHRKSAAGYCTLHPPP